MRITLATCSDLPNLDATDAPLVDALTAAGADVGIVPWTDGAEACANNSSLVVVRTTWDYTKKLPAFLQWADDVSKQVALENKPSMLRWNAYKRYLTSLPSSIAVVPTQLLWQGTTTADQVAAMLTPSLASHVVIKPEVGAGGFDTRVFDVVADRDSLMAFALEQTRVRDMMLQPLQPRIRSHGETSLVFIDGQFLLAINKRVGDLMEFRIQERFGGVNQPITPTDQHLAFATRVLHEVGGDPLIARIDIVDHIDGTPQLMELELIEPSLFLTVAEVAPQAMRTVAAAFLSRQGKKRFI